MVNPWYENQNCYIPELGIDPSILTEPPINLLTIKTDLSMDCLSGAWIDWGISEKQQDQWRRDINEAFDAEMEPKV